MTTMNTYTQIKDESFNFNNYGGFFAFDDEQFENNKIGNEPFTSLGNGLYCSSDNVDSLRKAFKNFVSLKNNKIRNECDILDVFIFEYYNYECDYTGDISEALEVVIRIYGLEATKTLSKLDNKFGRAVKRYYQL